MGNVSDVLGRITVIAAGVSNIVAQDALLRAARNLCQRGLAYHVDITAVPVALDTPTYSLAPPSDTEVWMVPYVKQNGVRINQVDNERMSRAYPGWDGAAPAAGSKIQTFKMDDLNTLRVWPMPNAEAVDDIVPHAVLVPTRTAATLPDDFLTRYEDAIVSGALSEVLLMPRKPWTDTNLAVVHAGLMANTIGEARVDYIREGSTGEMTMQAKPFGSV